MKTVLLVHLSDAEMAQPGQLDSLLNELRRTTQWRECSRTLWLLYTEEEATRLYRRLAPHVPRGVRLVLADVGERVLGSLSDEDGTWIRRRLPACWLDFDPEIESANSIRQQSMVVAS